MSQELKWQILAEGRLNLCGTKILIDYCPGTEPYHIHRIRSCHGTFTKLEDAKNAAKIVLHEILELGMEP